jgi:hypothetical protein
VVFALLALPGTALANFNILARYYATTSNGQTCSMDVLGGSDNWAGPMGPNYWLFRGVFSEVDYGAELFCPTGTLSWSSGYTDEYENENGNPGQNPQYVKVGGYHCQQGVPWGTSGADDCNERSPDYYGRPGNLYMISNSLFEMQPNSGSWSSYPSFCRVNFVTVLECDSVPPQYVRGYVGF